MSDRQRVKGSLRQEKVAAYKSVLRQCLDRRPSGVRQRIAMALGTHRSFVSQITNPSEPTAIPARHVPVLLEFVHPTEEERARFTEAYEEAHPDALIQAGAADGGARKRLTLEIPVLANPAAQAALEDLVRSTAQRLATIARIEAADGSADNSNSDDDREDGQ